MSLTCSHFLIRNIRLFGGSSVMITLLESNSISAAKDTPGTSWSLDPQHKGVDPLGFPRSLP